jgi:ATP-dependent protease ClpP protease subunit
MPKEILLYSSIYSYSVTDFIKEMEAAKGDDVRIRINSPGGEVYAGFGAIAKFHEHPKKKSIQVDGRADSFAAIICCCAEDVECLDVSTFLFHRASIGEYWESKPEYFTDEVKASLSQMNAQLRAFMEGKMNGDEFEKVTGVSLDDLFSLDTRLDVVLTAKQAKKLGLVNKIVSITPAKKAEIESRVMAIAAMSIPTAPAAEDPAPPPQPPLKNQIMTAAEFKAAHPAAYAEIVSEGVNQERDRVGSFLAFNDVDPEAVAKGIKDGTALTATQMAEFSRKAFSAQAKSDLETDSPKNVTTGQPETPKTPEAKAAEDFAAEVRKGLNLATAK